MEIKKKLVLYPSPGKTIVRPLPDSGDFKGDYSFGTVMISIPSSVGSFAAATGDLVYFNNHKTITFKNEMLMVVNNENIVAFVEEEIEKIEVAEKEEDNV